MFIRRGILIIGLTFTFIPLGAVFSGENVNPITRNQMTSNDKTTKTKKIIEYDNQLNSTNENIQYNPESLDSSPKRTFPDQIGNVLSGDRIRVRGAKEPDIQCVFDNHGQNPELFEGAECWYQLCVLVNGENGEPLERGRPYQCTQIDLDLEPKNDFQVD